MTVVDARTINRYSRAEYLERATALRQKRGSRCEAKHFAFTTCKECKMEIPAGAFTPSEWNVYFEPLVIHYGGPSTTSPEWRAEIFAASDAYNAAKARFASASAALSVAEVALRHTPRGETSETIGMTSSAYLAAEQSVEDLERAVDLAETEMRDALQELNRISRTQKKAGGVLGALRARVQRIISDAGEMV